MDIFTKQLTRVVAVPIKPANLKVKALLKEAGTSKLKEDLDHLENHDNYFVEKPANDANEENEQESKPDEQQAETIDKQSTDSESKEEVKHLDLYV